MRVFFHLSGEHPTLPRSEVFAALEAVEAHYEVLADLDQALVIEVDDLRGVHERLAMSHRICEFYGTCEPNLAEIEKIVGGLEFEGGFAVRIRRIKQHRLDIDTLGLEGKIGGMIEGRVDLDKPENTIYGMLTDRLVLGRVLYEIDRSQYEERRPHKRPYFRPGVMMPRNCRAIVNLARAKSGEKFVDPFCGTGGFLIEAGLLGASVYGFDVDNDAIEGCRKNLERCAVKRYELREKDARELKNEYSDAFDALAADLPYGISTSTYGMGLEELCSASLESFLEILRPGKYACVVAPSRVPLREMAEHAGFEVVEEHTERIHRSLVRRMLVLKKPAST